MPDGGQLTLREIGRAAGAERLRVTGLFAGIGGIELGLHTAGHTTELLCELDDAASTVLGAHFDVPISRDIRKLRIGSVPDSEVLAGGFPCQDLSQAGRTAGIRGRQSGLVDEMFRLMEGMRPEPRWVLFENVPFMLRLERGEAMRYLTETLSAKGYIWAYRIVDTRAFGLPQRRQRVIMLASRVDDPRRVLFADDAGERLRDETKGTSYGFYWTEGVRGLGWGVDCVPTLKGGSTVGIPSPPAIWMPDGKFILPDIRDAERLQGFPANWTRAARNESRRPDAPRWKLIGNAVSVPVARWVGRCLANPRRPVDARQSLLESGKRWPIAAWGAEGEAYSYDISSWPKAYRPKSLGGFLKHPGTPLSLRAATGFRARTKRASLRFRPEFLEALDAYIASRGGDPRAITEHTGRRRQPA
ncbi:MAG: DNA cytosine methyltransferase [Deltaproteobacteria bacterium]|nr:DNA cytosine methyltransferase [Deltaproteobacteria bacterium]